METDFEGTMHDVDPEALQDEEDDDVDDDREEEEELDKEMGDVDQVNEEVVDSKLWDDENDNEEGTIAFLSCQVYPGRAQCRNAIG